MLERETFIFWIVISTLIFLIIKMATLALI
jgi:hypothetical protein